MAKKSAAGKRDRVITPTRSFSAKRTAGGQLKERTKSVGRSEPTVA